MGSIHAATSRPVCPHLRCCSRTNACAGTDRTSPARHLSWILCNCTRTCKSTAPHSPAQRPEDLLHHGLCLRPWPAARRKRQHCQIRSAAAPRWNPQNVDNPVTMPSPDLSAEEAVAVQLEALMRNDEPWPAHGIQTCYEFGEGIGGLDPCWYFGYRKDLCVLCSADHIKHGLEHGHCRHLMYHMDHFAGQFRNTFPFLLGAESYKVINTKEVDAARTVLEVAVVPAGEQAACSVVFALRRKTIGNNKGAWLTKMLLPGTLEEAMETIQGMAAPR